MKTTPPFSRASRAAASVLVRGSTSPRSIWATALRDRSARSASFCCDQRNNALPARICRAVIIGAQHAERAGSDHEYGLNDYFGGRSYVIRGRCPASTKRGQVRPTTRVSPLKCPTVTLNDSCVRERHRLRDGEKRRELGTNNDRTEGESGAGGRFRPDRGDHHRLRSPALDHLPHAA